MQDQTQTIIIQDIDPASFTIESMRSKEYSIGIFVFMVFGIVVFGALVVRSYHTAQKEGIKIGERLMFYWLMLGLVVAIAYGAVQLLYGQLI